MSKNTNISELINHLSYDGSGNIVFHSLSAASTNTDKFLVSDGSTLKHRTAAQLLSDIGAQASGSYQAALSGTGFVKISGSTISYDNSTYATETYVGTAISNLVASSPATLDTLNELALALGSDPNFATTVATSIGTKQPQLNGTGFVKVTGTTISYDNSTYALDSAVVKLAVTQTITGAKTFTQRITTDEGLILKDLGSATYITPSSGYGGISYNNTVAGYSRYYFSENNGSTSILNFPTTVSSKVYTYPNASGILALTSDIPTNNNVLTNGAGYITSSALSTYIPLAGGTLTGALSGTSASFSLGVTIANSNWLNFTDASAVSRNILILASDNNLYLQYKAGSNFYLRNTDGDLRLTIASTGAATFSSRVNINGATDNVLYALNIYGDATFSGTRAAPAYIYALRGGDDSKLILKAGSTAGYFSQIDVSGWNGTGTPAYISLNSGSGTGIYVKLGNNIGVGTVTPSAKLDVYSGADATSNTVLWGQIIRNEGNGAATGYGAGLKLKISSDGEPYKWAGIAAVAGTGYSNRTDLGLFTAATSTADATEKVRITGDGYFGINTISPSGRLHVYQSAASDTYLETGTGGTSGKLIFKTSDNGDLNKYIAQEAYYMMFSGNANEGFKWRDSNSNVLMALFGSNNAYGNRLGIGTTTPSDKLDVQGASGVGIRVSNSTNAAYNANLVVNLNDVSTMQLNCLGTTILQSGNTGNTVLASRTNTNIIISPAGTGKVGIGTTDFSDITFGSSALKIGGSRAALGLTSSGSLSTIALVAGNNTATAMHLNFENTGAFRWYSYVSGGEIFTLLGNGRLGLGVSSPDAKLHVVGPVLVSNGAQTYRRAITCHGQTGTYTQIKVHFNKTSWGSVTYDIKLASAGGSHHTAGGYYSNPGLGSHVNSINAGTGLSMTFVAGSQSGDTQGATWTFSGGTFIHPILTIDIGCGNGYQVNPDDIVVVYT